MKIVKINTLKNVGILDEDTYKNEFQLYKTENKNGQINTKYMSKILIRGDNGTGKSTLSNIFRSVEEKTKTEEIINKIKDININEEVQIEIELDNGNILKYDNIQKKWLNDEEICIKVFNEDYINENLNLEEFSQNKIDGKYEAKEVEISIEKKEYEESKKRKEEIIEEGRKISKEILDKINKSNSEIKKDFDQYCAIDTKIEQYNELDNEEIYLKAKSDIENYMNNFNKLKTSETFTPLKTNNVCNNINIDELYSFLEYTEDSSKINFIDQFLEMDIERKEWMDKGTQYIKDKKCPFCKNDISKNDFINEYIKYRNSNNKKVEENLVKYKKELENYRDNVQKDIKILLSKNNEYKGIVDIKEDISENTWSTYTNSIENIINVIDEKLKDVSKIISNEMMSSLPENLNIIQTVIDKSGKIDKETENINKVMLNSKKELSSIRLKVKDLKKNILEYEMRENLNKRKKLLKELEVEEKNNKEKKIKYEKKLEDADITIKEMNIWLEFFGMSMYKVNKDFNLIYKDNNINNRTFILSTGEVSALAFSYYLATLVVGLTEEEKRS